MNALEASSLGKRFRRSWALRDCTLELPEGRIIALVGPNGAGKTTLLLAAVGLLLPTEGCVTVLGGRPAGSMEALDAVGFVAQDTPLYPNLTVASMIRVAKGLNRSFDEPGALERLDHLGINPSHKVGKLSGGQHAQLALTLALAREPALLILDEPLARLDPVARHDFMAQLMSAVAELGTTVVFSSHVVTELERVADYLVLLARGRIALAEPLDKLVSDHGVVTLPANDIDTLSRHATIVQSEVALRNAHALVRWSPTGIRRVTPTWEVSEPTVEEIILGYLRAQSSESIDDMQHPELAAVGRGASA